MFPCQGAHETVPDTNTKNSLAHIKSSLKIVFLNKPITKGRLFLALFIFRGRTENVSTAKDLYAFSLSLKKEYNISGTFLGKQNSSPIHNYLFNCNLQIPFPFLAKIPLSHSLTFIIAPVGFPSSTQFSQRELSIFKFCTVVLKNLKNGSS